MPVRRQFGAVARKRHSILKFRRLTPDLPPHRVGFEQVPERMLRPLLFEPRSVFPRALQVARIDLFEHRQRFGVHGQRPRARRGAEERDGTEKRTCGPEDMHGHSPSLRRVTQVQLLRRTSLSRSSKVAKGNGFCKKMQLGGSCDSEKLSALPSVCRGIPRGPVTF